MGGNDRSMIFTSNDDDCGPADDGLWDEHGDAGSSTAMEKLVLVAVALVTMAQAAAMVVVVFTASERHTARPAAATQVERCAGRTRPVGAFTAMIYPIWAG